jgi:hypothetical protein
MLTLKLYNYLYRVPLATERNMHKHVNQCSHINAMTTWRMMSATLSLSLFVSILRDRYLSGAQMAVRSIMPLASCNFCGVLTSFQVSAHARNSEREVRFPNCFRLGGRVPVGL